MKKLFLLLATMLPAVGVMADEGMWTISNLPQAVYQKMQEEGFKRSYDDLYKSDSAIMKTVVNFGNFCSGVVVSPDGLVFTNHHCGFDAIRRHSTVEHDYMRDGFYAKTFEEELPNENLIVSFMVEQKDVTKELNEMGIQDVAPSKLYHFIDSVQTAWSADIKAQDSTLTVEILPFYEGNAYYMTTYRVFTDVRLVFTIPKSMGKFGGETDNWMWPRQTCDFSVFRIYANKDNKPADYSKDNVPYRPEHWAPVSMEGYKDGDFAMTMGYPGSTSRYLSSYGIREMRDAENDPRQQVRGVKQQVMWRHMGKDQAVRIKYDSKYAQSSNYWKNSIGMNKCIDSIGLIKQKADYEQKIRDYQEKTGYLKGKLDFDLLQRLYAKRLDIVYSRTNFNETFWRTNELATRALRVHNGMEVKGPENKKKKQYVEFEDNSETWDAALDKEVFAVLLQNYRDHVDQKWLPEFYQTIDEKFNGNCTAYVDWVWENSILMKPGEKIYINKKSFLKDPGVRMGLDLTDMGSKLKAPLKEIADSIAIQERYLCAAKLRMEQDMPNYSDANFTMRLSYGQVGGYLLGGKPSGYYTEAPSIIAKMEQMETTPDYYAEPIMKELLSAKDFGQYTDPTTGKMHLCFLTNNDITGGNSGSPMFDGQGRLIGLAFDGNWDSLASDILFDSVLARCIGVDIRFVIFMMDKWGKADRLLKEINSPTATSAR